MGMIINVLEKSENIPNNWNGIGLCIDGVNLKRAQKRNEGTYKALEKQGYFVRLINPERLDEMKCPYDIAGRKIGVFDICDYHLVESIANGYRIPHTQFSYSINYISLNKINNIEKLLVKDYDVIYTYVMPGSEFEKAIYTQRVYISGFENIDVSRINVFYPNIILKKTYMDDLYSWNSKNRPKAIYNRKTTVNLLWTNQYIYTVGNQKKIQKLESFISRLSISKEMSDPTYRCYGDIKNENRALCNSSYDPWGNIKKDKTYWDIPCIEDTDCPFYKANKNYPNEFGKCMSNGICEFPVGIRRLAYVKYDDEFPYTPMCYGCDSSILDCCKDQIENPEKYPELNSPDYAFSNDTTLREPRELETIIPML
jgi:hypothetical protein